MVRHLAFVTVFAASPLMAQDVQLPPEPAPAQEEPVQSAQAPAPTMLVIPPLPTPRAVETAVGNTASIGNQVAEVIANDLRSTGLYDPSGPDAATPYSFLEATAPAFAKWRGKGAKTLVSGYVEARRDGRLSVGCYLYDVPTGRELARQGYAVSPTDWRRAAHKCADAIYARLSGDGPLFDSRVAYIAEAGPRNQRVKRIAMMNWDGTNHRYLTAGQAAAVSPRFSPDGKQMVYTSFLGRMPRVFVVDVASGNERMIVPGRTMTFAARFSPDGRNILFSMAENGNTDLYVINAYGGVPQRLTSSPGTDTAPSYSPDGRQIVFESDRSGTQQLYVMDADGSNQRRISFGEGRFGSPEWSPSGDLIAFVQDGRIGVMTPTGSGITIVTDGGEDEAPGWSPNGKFILFSRTGQASGQSALHLVPIKGGAVRQVTTPQGASDATWATQG